ncbi:MULTISPECIES: thiolase domain-containing protein [unclassified Sphingomonas]|uniref:thiolase domain-containing protein n=1 Tax=unclassified Sphingomonas TaxID=196159 RepID=UPI00082FA263|nr:MULTISPECIES: thiolase domain-containing protein [unclassified Sphingomonas]MCH4893259.1 thiolase domain-containing protein [Sphingomonas sp. SFZ2018-12]
MSARPKAYIAGISEHPVRKATDLSTAQIVADVVRWALADAGLDHHAVDGFLCDAEMPGLGVLSIAEYLGLRLTYMDNTDPGGSAYQMHVAHAAEAIAAGKCNVAIVVLAGRPRAAGAGADPKPDFNVPELAFEHPYGSMVLNQYAMVAQRHMHEYGLTSEQLAWVKVAASHHAQHNPHAMLKNVVTVEEVVESPMIADPLHRLDCCVVSDGGGAIVVVSPEIARSLNRPLIAIRGAGEAVKHLNGGRIDLTYSSAREAGRIAFEQAGVTPADIKYASIYDSFTITVVQQLEDLGFCPPGGGGRFVADGNLISGVGKLPFNTDGGGLCSNHPNNRGGMTKILEAVRQLRGEAHPAVQVPNCDLALAQGMGGWLGSRNASGTLILERE